jgi:hypothetical protein
MSSLASVVAAVVLAAATPRPEWSPAVASSVAGVRIISQAGRWTSLLATNELADSSDTMFLISGEIENTSAAPVSWVKLAYELLADTTDGEVVLASEYGYNFRAEALRGPAVEAGTTPATAVPVRSLAPGEKDLFRMVFFRADVPRFDRWRVRILEVR